MCLISTALQIVFNTGLLVGILLTIITLALRDFILIPHDNARSIFDCISNLETCFKQGYTSLETPIKIAMACLILAALAAITSFILSSILCCMICCKKCFIVLLPITSFLATTLCVIGIAVYGASVDSDFNSVGLEKPDFGSAMWVGTAACVVYAGTTAVGVIVACVAKNTIL